MPRALMINRRFFILGAAALTAGCTTEGMGGLSFLTAGGGDYGAMQDGKFLIPAADLSQVNPEFYRQTVATPAGLPGKPGNIVVDPTHRHLYLVQAGGRSLRYGVGVGREGFAWSGEANVGRKDVWPHWTPPAEMVKRDPLARKVAGGMPGGLDNPLGARALYLYQGGTDSLYRIHGTTEPWSIGQAVSSGCIRLINQDIIDLYNRVPVGTHVYVLSPGAAARVA